MASPTVFSQLIKLIPRTQFQEYVTKYNGDARVRSLDCWTWFGSLLFGQITGLDGLFPNWRQNRRKTEVIS